MNECHDWIIKLNAVRVQYRQERNKVESLEAEALESKRELVELQQKHLELINEYDKMNKMFGKTKARLKACERRAEDAEEVIYRNLDPDEIRNNCDCEQCARIADQLQAALGGA